MIQFADTSIENLWTADQWTYIRKNTGEWHGSFIQFSPEADWVSDTPSVLTLEEDRLDQHMVLVLKRTPQGKSTQTTTRELGYPGAVPYICFFPTGAFSQGAMQRRPWSSFGAEFCLLSGNRRLRLVQLYNGNASGEHILDYVTLIPEYRPGVDNAAHDAARLSIDTLLGPWHGDRLYLPATMDKPQVTTSHWQAQRSGAELILLGDKELQQKFTPVDQYRWQAVDDLKHLWLLPGGVSCTVYPQLASKHPAQIEVCWYLSDHRRQRIVRDYDANGNWVGTALMIEMRG
ncbi:MAG: DUF3598 family protein [Cyanobacteria bacterium P01_B01_bin.77]